ncbi:MAG TPA: amino acid adenylation domain-containing protein [Longimicrobium sp.]|nr:amino acid adenylation domain-containing protein [Longimicrobium sp.]
MKVTETKDAGAAERGGAERSPRAACVHHPFEARAARDPHAVAVVDGTATLTYGELEARANRLAHALLRRGAGPEVRVGVCLERSAELVVGLLGILKAGAAYVPLDPHYPRERIAATLDDARASLLVSRTRFRALLAGHRGDVLWLDADRDAVEVERDTRPASRGEAGNLAYLIYTSGSTGRPKGVQIEHRSATALLAWCRRTWTPEECAVVLGSTSVCFDMHVFEVFHTLAVGGKIVMAENALALPTLPARDEVTLVNTVPSAAAELLRSGGLPRSVRTVNLGGEPLKGALARGLYALGHVERVFNLYGPTEDTTYSTALLVPRGGDREPTVGRAVTGTRIHLLDDALDPVADGEVGEVYLSGAGLARGYLGRPGLTAEKYLPCPFGEPGGRMYRVGDLGRFLPDGELDCLGRIDHQVKVRGFRVELGEVEAVLLAHPAVRDAVVVAREDATGDRRLAAYVVAGGIDAQGARAWVAERLPDYMVPSAVILLDAFPRLPNGKVDRVALPAPEFGRGDEAGYVAPRTPTEARLAEVWAEVLGIDRVGAEDSFFDLGGHSLRAAQVITRVRDALGVELPLSALFDAPTVAALAARVEAAERSAGLPPIVPVPRDRPIPLSLPQEAIWYFQELAPGMKSYNFQAAFRFRGALDADALQWALDEIVRRHEIFRTTFPEIDGTPSQVIHPPLAADLARFDLRGLPPEAREAEIARHQEEAFGTPFDLSVLPLIRWRLLRLADDEHLLLQVEHHFVHDGWSFAVFLRELVALYTARVRGEPSPLPELPVQFADFAAWHRELMRGERARADLAYWKEALSGADPVLALPTDRPRPAEMSFRGSSLRVRIPPGTVRAARAFSREHGATLYMTLMAAFQALMHRYTGQEDFCLGGGVANRSWRETEPMIGMLVNTIALRARPGGAADFRALVARVRETAREAYAHKDVHFGQVVEAVAPERSLGHLPIYQVCFNFHDSAYPDLRLPGVEVELTEALSNGSAKFDLQVICMPRAEMIPGAPDDLVECVWEYATDLFDQATVERMAGHFHALLAGLVAEPGRSPSSISLLTDEEARRVVVEWNRTDAPAAGRLVHERVADHARTRPEAVALRAASGETTYGELHRRASALARRLRALGAGPESRVAVCTGRSPEMVVAQLAVLYAGAAYLPVDPEYPAERIAWLLDDARAPVVLTLSSLAGRLPRHGAATVFLDEIVEVEDADEPAIPHSPFPVPSLAYVIYTSGSTGRPKGVMVEHRGLANLVDWHLRAYGLGPGDRSAPVASPGFDAAVWEVWPALAAGATLSFPPDEVRASPSELAAWLAREGVTVTFLPTPLAEAVLDERWDADAKLRALLTGGDALGKAPRPGLPFRLFNHYGPTENAVVGTGGEVAPSAGAVRPSIGRPIDNVRAYVLDAAGGPLPPGVPGELYLGGAGVARGYLGRPAMTAERFVPDPFSGIPGARLYRTGDRVRWRESASVRECVSASVGAAQEAGHEQRNRPPFTHAPTHSRTHALEFLGRADDQVKVRGYRIEPGEVEAALLAHPSVREAAVVARGEGAGRRLVGYVSGNRLNGEEVRSFLRGRLPAHLVPSDLVVLDALPLNPHGKVDRRALPAPEAVTGGGHGGMVPPRTPAEREVAAVWASLLGTEPGVYDDFFALGGHSLLAGQVVSRVARDLGVRVTLGEFLREPTVAALAARVDAARAAREEATAIRPVAWRDGERLLAGINHLSPEQVEALLGELMLEGER